MEVAQVDHQLRGLALHLQKLRQVHRALAVHVLLRKLALHQQAAHRVLRDLRLNAQHLRRAVHQRVHGQVHVAHGVDRLGQHVLHAADQPRGMLRREAHVPCNRVRRLEAHAVDLVRQAVGILTQHRFTLVAVGLVHLHRKRRTQPCALQKDQRGAHAVLFGEGFGDGRGLLRPDAGDLRQAVGLALQHVQRVHAEVLHDQLGRRRPHAPDQARREVLLHAALGFRAQQLVGIDLDLLSVVPMLHQLAVKDRMLPGVQERQDAHGADAPRALHIEGDDRPAVCIVAEDDLLHRSLKL